MYCMLADYFNDASFKSLNLEILAQKWMDVSFEVREAAQSLLKNELRRIGPNGRSTLIKYWEQHLSNLLKECEDVTNTSYVSLNTNTQSSSSNTTSQQAPNNSQHHLTSSDSQQTISPPSQGVPVITESITRIKRKQYIAIIILGVMGSEFGQDVSTSKTQAPYKTIPQGFSIDDHTILKRISKCSLLID